MGLVGYSVPIFWLGLMALVLFYAKLGWVGGPGRIDVAFEYSVERVTGLLLVDAALAGEWEAFRNAFSHLVLPASLLGYFSLAYISRMTRSLIIAELAQEHIAAARAKGLSEARIIWRHALRNAMVPLVTVIALTYPGLLEGSVLTETVFAWPRLGLYITNSLQNADMNAVLDGTIVVGAVFIVLALVVMAVFADVLAPYSPAVGDLRTTRLLPPSAAHWRGTDDQGRDILSRLIHGSRITLFVVVLVAVLAAPVGLLVGTVADYAGGWVDAVLMRITDIFLAFPRLILALAFVAALGPGIENAVIAIAITSWPPYARIARAETLTIRQADYIAAVRLLGASPGRIVLRHVMPLCMSSVIVRVTLDMAGIILTAAGLGCLGLGAQPPSPEWGAMIAGGRAYVLDQWWVAAAPGAAIFLVSLAFNLLGDGLRDALDPKAAK